MPSRSLQMLDIAGCCIHWPFLGEQADGLEVINGIVSRPESSLLPCLAVVQCVKHALQDDVKEYLVVDGEEDSWVVILDVSLITFLVEYDNR